MASSAAAPPINSAISLTPQQVLEQLRASIASSSAAIERWEAMPVPDLVTDDNAMRERLLRMLSVTVEDLGEATHHVMQLQAVEHLSQADEGFLASVTARLDLLDTVTKALIGVAALAQLRMTRS
jgi:hypothetical protein